MEHRVRQGETLSSVAEKYGLTWDKLWNHPQNAELKRKRTNPHILYPGDVVHVPDKERGEEQASTTQRHRFTVKTKTVKLRLRLQEDGSARSNVKYTLDVEGRTFQGTTDGRGQLEHEIPASAKQARLTTSDDSFVIQIGHLDPIHEESGADQRLRNLGYLGDVGEGGEARTAAIRSFQESAGLETTGALDDRTRQQLEEAHGC